MNTHTININLGTTYDGFVIDVWIYPDLRFAAPAANDVIFLTNNHSIVYGVKATDMNIGWNGTKYTDIFTTDDNLNLTSWNHFVFFSDSIGANTNYYGSFRHTVYPGMNAAANTVNAQVPLSNIYFCNNDAATYNVCGGNWINAYYKNLRVWDSKFTNMWAVIYNYQ